MTIDVSFLGECFFIAFVLSRSSKTLDCCCVKIIQGKVKLSVMADATAYTMEHNTLLTEGKVHCERM